jgi:multidrug resistance efflux pump
MNEVVNKLKGRLGLIVLAVAVVIIVSGFYIYQHYRNTHISTDDSYVTGRIHVVASKVPGTVKALLVKDNQFVKEKDTLLEIDDQDYSVKVRESESTVGAEKARLEEIGSRGEVARKQLTEFNFRMKSAKANLRLETVNLKQSEIDFHRMERLFANKIIAEDIQRNLGGSMGVAFATTMLSRGTQIHQAHLSEHITSFDSGYWNAANQSAQLLSLQGMDPVTAQQGGAGVIHNELLRQAYMLSFNDVFFVLTIMMICMLPFILFMRHVDHSAVKP